ncbi:MAG: BCCT family transporter [Eubacteriales bacterium]
MWSEYCTACHQSKTTPYAWFQTYLRTLRHDPRHGTSTKVASDFKANVSVVAVGQGFNQAFDVVSGASRFLFGWEVTPTLILLLTLMLVVPAVISSCTGVLNGIRVLSDFNTKLYFALLIFLAVVGNIAFSWNLGLEALGEFLSGFFRESLMTGTASGDPFAKDWLNYNFACWMSTIAIAPVFLGSLCRGRTVKEAITYNFFLPCIFGFVWMSILGGTTIFQDLATGGFLTEIMNTQGTEFLP